MQLSLLRTVVSLYLQYVLFTKWRRGVLCRRCGVPDKGSQKPLHARLPSTAPHSTVLAKVHYNTTNLDIDFSVAGDTPNLPHSSHPQCKTHYVCLSIPMTQRHVLDSTIHSTSAIEYHGIP